LEIRQISCYIQLLGNIHPVQLNFFYFKLFVSYNEIVNSW